MESSEMKLLHKNSQSNIVVPKKINVIYPPEAVSQLLFRKYVDDNTLQFLNILKDIMTHHHSPDFAQSIHQGIIKVSTKVAFLYKQKYLSKSQIISLRGIFRRVCSTLINTFRLKGLQPIDSKKIQNIQKICNNFRNSIVELVGPFVEGDCLDIIGSIFEYFSSDGFLRYCFLEASDIFKEVIFILATYLEIS
eukprot:TRINITY_DN2789_c1_g5_i1.p1 TRINITY_DN2789_c1_g5~~TRINITY_DN2789_c1_g5_i1.p1  ORF type:complete len:193 (-),score=53.06 TRINITY_DN2789_c1_g5_i1:92-670(-)